MKRRKTHLLPLACQMWTMEYPSKLDEEVNKHIVEDDNDKAALNKTSQCEELTTAATKVDALESAFFL